MRTENAILTPFFMSCHVEDWVAQPIYHTPMLKKLLMIVACVSVFSGLMYADTDVVIDLSGITQKNASTDVNNGITVTSTRKSQSVTYLSLIHI